MFFFSVKLLFFKIINLISVYCLNILDFIEKFFIFFLICEVVSFVVVIV